MIQSYPKPEPRAKVKARAKRQRTLSRRQCREVVYEREHMRCQRCSRAVSLSCHFAAPERAHVHEVVPRSLGGDPCSPANCLLVCKRCHMLLHRLKVA